MEQRPLIRRTTSALSRFVVVVLILTLGGAVLFLLSQLNASGCSAEGGIRANSTGGYLDRRVGGAALLRP